MPAMPPKANTIIHEGASLLKLEIATQMQNAMPAEKNNTYITVLMVDLYILTGFVCMRNCFFVIISVL